MNNLPINALCILLILAATAGAAMNGYRDSSSFGCFYECNDLPTNAGFQQDGSFSTADGILSCSLDAWFTGESMFNVTPATSYTVEFRSRTLTSSGMYPGLGAMFSNNGSSIAWFAVGTDQVMEAYSQQTYTNMDNLSDFHTYRVAYEADTGYYNLWRDSQRLTAPSTPLGLSGNYGTIFQFGTLSPSSPGSSEIDYLRWDVTGAYAPTDEPPPNKFPGVKSSWSGYDRYDFSLNGFATRVVAPANAAPGNPWVMRGEFPDLRSEVDEGLLARGYHIVYSESIVQQFGSPTALARWDALYDTMTTQYDLSEKAVLEGISRSGLLVHRWAAQNPDKVDCILGFLPVCDIKSWPKGYYDGCGNPVEWQNLLNAYGFTEAEAMAFDGNPIDLLQPLADAGIRILHVAGDSDIHVPLDENSRIVYDRYLAMGGEMSLIVVPGDHITAWVDDVTPILDFVTVPEPASILLVAVALGISGLRRKHGTAR
ncbi:MAG: PEP-CTERM sorting domain-containing protein [Phycisphaerae bacterium]|nr:PEP-CTERM sorting domain-containing protein [Phycisphaerae bacterium]